MSGQLDDATHQFRIGAVSRITQIPIDTLRAWERRYAVVEPGRTSGSARLYSEEDIARLKLIKRLVDSGHAISSVAACTLDELEKMLVLHQSETVASNAMESQVESILVFRGPDAHIVDLHSAEGAGITIAAEYSEWDEFQTAAKTQQPDALVLKLATILNEDALKIGQLSNQLHSTRVILTYGFASQANIERLVRDNVIALRAPVSGEEVTRLLTVVAPDATHGIKDIAARPRRLFDDATLEELAKVSSTVQCECPHHLVDIVKTLNQFERYSAECESRSEEDAALHAQLSITTAISRSMFEKALLEVAEYEGIELPESIRNAVVR